jgi:DNA-binding transcriptional ArsR family regulator
MSTTTTGISDLLFGQIRGGILGLLYGHPDQSFYIREISKHVRKSTGSVRRELATLAKFGLIERSESGRQVYYKANCHSPVFEDLSSLVAKTVGVFQQLVSALTPVASRISAAVVYGSMARGEEKAGSDVDLMIVGDVTLDAVLTQLVPVEGAIGRPINPTVYSADEFKRKLEMGNHFLRSLVRGETVPLIGDLNELGTMG